MIKALKRSTFFLFKLLTLTVNKNSLFTMMNKNQYKVCPNEQNILELSEFLCCGEILREIRPMILQMISLMRASLRDMHANPVIFSNVMVPQQCDDCSMRCCFFYKCLCTYMYMYTIRYILIFTYL